MLDKSTILEPLKLFLSTVGNDLSLIYLVLTESPSTAYSFKQFSPGSIFHDYCKMSWSE